MDFKKLIRDIPDYPKKGIVFKDITTLLQDGKAFQKVIELFRTRFEGQDIQKICGIESRGFIFGAALAYAMGIGFVPVRKSGKLPWTKISQEYTLEYGTDTLEIHADAAANGERILIVDDLLATGGTVRAVCHLLNRMKAHVVALAFLTELQFLKGREQLRDFEIFSLVQYD